jgi:hypothetical protein
MAYKKKSKAVESEANPRKDKLKLIRERDKMAREADHENRTAAMDDLKFVHIPGEQWEQKSRDARGLRPCYEFNKTRVTIKRVVNDMRANRPSGKVRGVEETDKDTAETLEGLIRNIWNVSDGDTVIDHAAEYQVGAGMGAWRVSVDYADDSAFEQDIKIEDIRNPFCLLADPACQDPLKRDARFWILTTRISKTSYEQRWPKAEVVTFETDTEFDNEDDDDWENEESIRIVEYWYKEPVEKTIYLLADGRAVDALPEGVQAIRERKVKTNVIKMCIASGKAILEEAEWAGSQFPFIMVFGENVVIDGKQRWFGLTRFAKDPARAYNYAQTAAIETVALAPQAKYWATPTQAEGHMDKWNVAHRENIPVMLYNVDPQVSGPPQPMPAPQVPVALLELARSASEDIKATTGIFDPSLGKQSNETSGVAINARAQQGEIVTFNYMDNLSKGIRRTWEILIDLIPKIYDTERAVRILGVDGGEKYVRVNQVDPMTGEKINDLSRGKYDVAVTVGPSFTTQRQEAAEIYTQMATKDPAMMPLVGDLIFKSMDYPYAEQMAERYKLMLPQPIQQAEGQGKELPPEAMQAMAQADQAMQQVAEQTALLQQQAAEVETGKQELQKMISDLKVEQANMEADYQKKVADLIKREAQFAASEAKAGSDAEGQVVKNDRQALHNEFKEAAALLQQRAAELMTQAAAVIAQMQQVSQPQVVNVSPPKRKIGRSKRQPDGSLEIEVVEVPEMVQ